MFLVEEEDLLMKISLYTKTAIISFFIFLVLPGSIFIIPLLNMVREFQYRSNISKFYIFPIFFSVFKSSFFTILGNYLLGPLGVALFGSLDYAFQESRRNENKKSNYPDKGKQNSYSPYDVLEISEGSSFEDIKKAYKTMIHQYHPDKVVNLGKELREVANRKSKEINLAYQELKKIHSRK